MKYKKTLLVLSIFLISANKTMALTASDLRATVAIERQDTKTTITQQRQTAKTTIIEQRQIAKTTIMQEKKSALSQIKKDKLTAIYNTIRNRLQARYQLKLNHKVSIESLINQKEIAGKDMTLAKNQLANFAQYEIAYQNDLTTFDTKYQSLLESATPLKLVPELKVAAKKVGQDLVEMNTVLRKTIEIIIKIPKEPTVIPTVVQTQ